MPCKDAKHARVGPSAGRLDAGTGCGNAAELAPRSLQHPQPAAQQPREQVKEEVGAAAATADVRRTLLNLTRQLTGGACGAPPPHSTQRCLAVVGGYLRRQQQAGNLPAEAASAAAELGLLGPETPSQEPGSSLGEQLGCRQVGVNCWEGA